MFFVIAVVVNVFYFVKDLQYYYLRDRVDYLTHVNSGSIYGFVLARWDDLRLNIVEISSNVEPLFNQNFNGRLEFEQFINNSLNISDKNHIHNLAIDGIYTKIIAVKEQVFEINFSKLNLRFNSFITLHCTDVSASMNEKEDLILREQKYRNLYNKNQAGVFSLNKDTVLIDSNDTFLKMFQDTLQVGVLFFKKEFFTDWEELYDIVTSKHNLKNYQTQINLLPDVCREMFSA